MRPLVLFEGYVSIHIEHRHVCSCFVRSNIQNIASEVKALDNQWKVGKFIRSEAIEEKLDGYVRKLTWQVNNFQVRTLEVLWMCGVKACDCPLACP